MKRKRKRTRGKEENTTNEGESERDAIGMEGNDSTRMKGNGSRTYLCVLFTDLDSELPGSTTTQRGAG